MLLSCHGGTGGSSSVAFQLSKRSGSFVIAAQNSSVSYGKVTKIPHLAVADRLKGNWVRISAVKGKTYKCKKLGKDWEYNFLN